MHNSMQVRAACALKDLLEPISMTSSENCRISLLLQAIHTFQASLQPNCEVEEWVLIQPHMGNNPLSNVTILSGIYKLWREGSILTS